jgi:AraC-like DNA-binding protein
MVFASKIGVARNSDQKRTNLFGAYSRFRRLSAGPLDPSIIIREVDGRSDQAFRYYSRLSRLKDYVESHHTEHISLSTAAKIAHLEAKYFSKYFHRKTGIPFKYWLAFVRIKRAVHLISNTDESLTQIAASVGFESLRTFERAFKRIVNVTPYEFKRRIRPS